MTPFVPVCVRTIVVLLLVSLTAIFECVHGQQRLRIVTLLQPPFLTQSKDEGVYEGFLMDMLEEMQRDMGFSYEIYLAPDGKFGDDDGYGRWNGLIGELINNEADMALAPLTVTSKREEKIDFAVPFWNGHFSIIYPSGVAKAPMIQTMTDLLNSNLRFGPVVDGSASLILNSSSSYRLYRDAGIKIQEWQKEGLKLPRSYEEGIDMVKSEHFAFITEDAVNYARSVPCDVASTMTDISFSYALAFPRLSKLMSDFSRQVLTMQENGYLQLLRDKWWQNSCRRSKLCVCEAL